MTDEECQKLVADLRRSHYDGNSRLRNAAADEIERLVGRVKDWELWAKSQPGYQDQEAALDKEHEQLSHMVFRPKLKRPKLIYED
jgi:hypothetical protein